MSSLAEGNSQFAVDLYGKLRRPAGEPVLLAQQHLDRPGDDLRRGARRDRRADGQGPALPGPQDKLPEAFRWPARGTSPRGREAEVTG